MDKDKHRDIIMFVVIGAIVFLGFYLIFVSSGNSPPREEYTSLDLTPEQESILDGINS